MIRARANHSNPARWLLDASLSPIVTMVPVLLFDVDAVWNSFTMPSADSAIHMTTAFCLETVIACCYSSGNHCALQQLAQSGGLRTGRCPLLYGCGQHVCWARNYCCWHVGPWIPPEPGSSKFHSCAKAHFKRTINTVWELLYQLVSIILIVTCILLSICRLCKFRFWKSDGRLQKDDSNADLYACECCGGDLALLFPALPGRCWFWGPGVLGSWAGLGGEHRKRILRGICQKSSWRWSRKVPNKISSYGAKSKSQHTTSDNQARMKAASAWHNGKKSRLHVGPLHAFPKYILWHTTNQC